MASYLEDDDELEFLNLPQWSEPGEKNDPFDNQLAAARQAQHRAGGARSAAIRYRFIARTEPESPPPPLARLLRGGGGRGGAARLKLYLSLLWLSRNEDKPVYRYPAHQWARLLGADQPDKSGARQVQEAFRWLDQESFVEVRRRQGAPSDVHLLSDAGTGRAYQAPGPAMKHLSKGEREAHLYVQLSAGFWTNGWIKELSGAAVAMYLVLLHEQRGENKAVWLSPRIGQERYDLSDETRRKGLNELVDRALASVRRRPLHQGLFEDHIRSRNVYLLDPQHMANEEPSDDRRRSF